MEGRVFPLVSSETGEEFLRVLAYPKFRLSVSDRQELIADYLLFCEPVTQSMEDLPDTPHCRDSFDRPFLLLTLARKADCLLTGDRDLLVLKDGFACPILSGDQFLASFGFS